MTFSNQLTLSRFALAFVMALCLTLPLPYGKTVGLVVFLVAALTDFWDGRIARRTGTTTVFGQLMDPLVDKMLVGSAFVSLVAIRQIVPAWIVIVILTREFLVTGLRLVAAGQGKVLPAGRWGKHKTAWQMAVIAAILAGIAFRDELLPLLWPPGDGVAAAAFDRWFSGLTFWLSTLVAVLTVVSGALYARDARRLLNTPP